MRDGLPEPDRQRHQVPGGEPPRIHVSARRDGHAAVPRPDVILLDLNLPRKDGREVLAEVKQDPDLRKIPVVVLTTSKAEEDVLRAYELNANCYITKPVDLDQFIKVVQTIEDFWFTIVRLPSGG
ncbi:MAG: response regulator [Nitrospirae bacterium]|nr:response regulator [Nitrospirota bacterium]